MKLHLTNRIDANIKTLNRLIKTKEIKNLINVQKETKSIIKLYTTLYL